MLLVAYGRLEVDLDPAITIPDLPPSVNAVGTLEAHATQQVNIAVEEQGVLVEPVVVIDLVVGQVERHPPTTRIESCTGDPVVDHRGRVVAFVVVEDQNRPITLEADLIVTHPQGRVEGHHALVAVERHVVWKRVADHQMCAVARLR